MHLYLPSRSKFRCCQQKVWIIVAAVLIFVIYLLLRGISNSSVLNYEDKARLFANFNNETGTEDGKLIVPNFIHFIVFKNPKIDFYHFICILAAMRNQRPDKIYFHTNVETFQGQYWERLMALKEFTNVLVINRIEVPASVFNQTITQIFHAGDVARIQMLMLYGGIYLDNDSYIVKSLDFYRKFEIAIGWDEGQYLGSQIIVANKDARFLELWLKSYNGTYDGGRWYYNAGELPTTSVLHKHPELIHRVKLLFGNDIGFIHKLFNRYEADWRDNFAFHLLSRHHYLLKNMSDEATYPVEFNEVNVQKYPVSFREMVNEVLYFEKYLKNGRTGYI